MTPQILERAHQLNAALDQMLNVNPLDSASFKVSQKIFENIKSALHDEKFACQVVAKIKVLLPNDLPEQLQTDYANKFSYMLVQLYQAYEKSYAYPQDMFLIVADTLHISLT